MSDTSSPSSGNHFPLHLNHIRPDKSHSQIPARYLQFSKSCTLDATPETAGSLSETCDKTRSQNHNTLIRSPPISAVERVRCHVWKLSFLFRNFDVFQRGPWRLLTTRREPHSQTQYGPLNMWTVRMGRYRSWRHHAFMLSGPLRSMSSSHS
jgi:hypothetical protein